MKLTTEEKAKLKSNIERIKAYIEAEISPKLCGEAITVYFGNVVHFANGTTGKQYRLYVDGRSVCGGAGNLLMNLLPTGTQKYARRRLRRGVALPAVCRWRCVRGFTVVLFIPQVSKLLHHRTAVAVYMS